MARREFRRFLAASSLFLEAFPAATLDSILVDSGFRRWTDAFKGLALGASAVRAKRPCLSGLAAFDQHGVETLLARLRREFEKIMIEMGTRDIASIGPAHVIPPAGYQSLEANSSAPDGGRERRVRQPTPSVWAIVS